MKHFTARCCRLRLHADRPLNANQDYSTWSSPSTGAFTIMRKSMQSILHARTTMQVGCKISNRSAKKRSTGAWLNFNITFYAGARVKCKFRKSKTQFLLANYNWEGRGLVDTWRNSPAEKSYFVTWDDYPSTYLSHLLSPWFTSRPYLPPLRGNLCRARFRREISRTFRAARRCAHKA